MGLSLFCSCATKLDPSANVTPTELPADTAINEDAGRGGHLIVTLQLDDGQKMLFMVDTGAPITLLDKSLESKLRKRRDSIPVSFVGGGHVYAALYAAPKLYLGNTKLLTGKSVAVLDFKLLPFRTNPLIVGILGMDCLRHYCIQLDFEAEKVRFLKSDKLEVAKLGEAFPLSFSRGFCPQVQITNFIGNHTNLMVDIGCNIDGMAATDAIQGLAVFLPEHDWHGESYTNLIIGAVGHANALGLRFLARHLVTFDFPKQTMYLKQRRVGALAGDHSLRGSHLGDLQPPMTCLLDLKETKQLPEWPKNQSPIYFETCSNVAPQIVKSVTFGIQGDVISYKNHYKIGHDSEGSPWKLVQAWKTDQHDKIIQEFAVP
jgi:hypothetical protein